ncbi:MAG: LacI family DNA-binding transcriptional regulator [Planctomycetota bacterium]|nr:LacI family DNA-binding transcriptional regulator [Planctomycetota bacterium]
MARRVSITTVAGKAGVSLTTVSMVLNGKSEQLHISETTRRRVLEVARKLGYRPRVPELFAAGVRGLLRHVSLAFVDPRGRETHEFFGPALYEIVRLAGREGLLVHGSDGVKPARVGAYCRERLRQDSDGLILFTFETRPAAWLDEVRRSGLPCVVYNRAFEGMNGVVMDHAGQAARQARKVLDLGHRRIACLANQGIGSAEPRFAGFHAELERAGCFDEEMLVHAGYDLDASAAAASLLFDRGGFTAILCTHDLGAMGVLRAARRKGVEIPRDCSVVSLDGYEFGRMAEPPLESVAYPRVEMARAALALLRKICLKPQRRCAHKVIRGKELRGGTLAAPRA